MARYVNEADQPIRRSPLSASTPGDQARVRDGYVVAEAQGGVGHDRKVQAVLEPFDRKPSEAADLPLFTASTQYANA